MKLIDIMDDVTKELHIVHTLAYHVDNFSVYIRVQTPIGFVINNMRMNTKRIIDK